MKLCDIRLSGLWKNELGSIMLLQEKKSNEILNCYNQNIGEAKYLYKISDSACVINGLYKPIYLGHNYDDKMLDEVAFNFAIIWNSKEFITTWNGQYRFINGQEIITTTELEKETKSNHSDNIFKDVNMFTKIYSEYYIHNLYNDCNCTLIGELNYCE